MTTNTPKIAAFDEYKDRLFDLYTRCRFHELICSKKMSRSRRINNVVKWSVLGLLGISLLTGSTSFLNPPILNPVWAVCGAIGTLLAAYSLIVASGEKEFQWLALVERFNAIGDEVEFFSLYVRLGKINEEELLSQWERFNSKIRDALGRGGTELREYAERNRTILTDELANILKQENKTP